MKTLLATVAVAVLGTGCLFVHVPPGQARSAASVERCPPGHQWSDGRCHAAGKGHDPAKHMK